jgi:hypothetical protein
MIQMIMLIENVDENLGFITYQDAVAWPERMLRGSDPVVKAPHLAVVPVDCASAISDRCEYRRGERWRQLIFDLNLADHHSSSCCCCGRQARGRGSGLLRGQSG